MKVAIAREIVQGETRVAAVPDTVARLKAAGFDVWVQEGAGEGSYISDAAYREAGAEVEAELSSLYQSADVILKVQPPSVQEIALFPVGSVLISFLHMARNENLLAELASREITTLALELLPRISRAQSMDVLSSQASLAGYKAVIIAADRLGKILPLQMTAAGTLAPARVFVLGAGVAGLQAIATARRLGAVVEAYDVRPAVKEEVESLGARFVDLPLESAEGSGGYAAEQTKDYLQRQRELLGERVAAADVVITTASIPGRTAPSLISGAMVKAMRPGSVIVDLAADSGGNCEVTEPGEEIEFEGVRVVGIRDVPTTISQHASQTYSRNIANLLLSLLEAGELRIDFADEIVKAVCVTFKGEVLWHPKAPLGQKDSQSNGDEVKENKGDLP